MAGICNFWQILRKNSSWFVDSKRVHENSGKTRDFIGHALKFWQNYHIWIQKNFTTQNLTYMTTKYDCLMKISFQVIKYIKLWSFITFDWTDYHLEEFFYIVCKFVMNFISYIHISNSRKNNRLNIIHVWEIHIWSVLLNNSVPRILVQDYKLFRNLMLTINQYKTLFNDFPAQNSQ